MSVLLETSLGDLVIDLDVEQCPKTCENFLKLCKTYKYNYLTFFSVQKNFLAQTGDPTNTGSGGSCIWSQLDNSSSSYSKQSYFTPERHRTLKHSIKGTVSMACTAVGDEEDDEVIAGSQFFVTLEDNIDYLDGKHAPFGKVVEGNEEGGTMDKINSAFVDKEMRPLRDIRIQHVVVLDDPFEDPEGLYVPPRTPSPTPQQLAAIGLDASANVDDPSQERPAEQVDEDKRKADTTAAALTLEMVGDLPFAEVRPPENILFVCKLNPITRSEDLNLIFSRFGKILSCEVIKDKKTGDSLQYAFIEFDLQESAEQVSERLRALTGHCSLLSSLLQAYFKMQNVLIDDRRIWVDFSQSVSKLSGSWNTSRSGGKPVRVSKGPGRGSVSSTPRVDRDLVFDFDERGSSRHHDSHTSYRKGDRSRDDRYREVRYRKERRGDDRYQDHRRKDDTSRDERRGDRGPHNDHDRDHRRYDYDDRRRYDDNDWKHSSKESGRRDRERSPAGNRNRHV